MNRPSLLEPADPHTLMTLSTAPLSGVLLSLLTVWIVAMPNQLHAVSLVIPPGCLGYTPPSQARTIHTVTISANGSLTWDGQLLASRAVLDARMRAVGDVSVIDQAEVHIQPHKLADYGVVVAIMASAQRNGVKLMGISGDGFSIVPMMYPLTGPISI